MQLIYSSERDRFEFLCGPTERTQAGELARALASKTRLRTTWRGNDLIFWTKDPLHARSLIEFATPAARDKIKADVRSRPLPVLTYQHGVYVWRGPIEGELDGSPINFRDEFPKKARMIFTRDPAKEIAGWTGPAEPLWWTANIDAAQQCARFADEAAKEAFEQKQSVVALSRAVRLPTPLEIPCPEGEAYDAHQPVCVAYAAINFRTPGFRGILIGDEMGGGKTISSAAIINYFPSIKHILIVCPAAVKLNWAKEMRKWLVRPMTVGITDTGRVKVVPDTDVVITNYEQLGKRIKSGAQIYDTKRKKMVDEADHVLRPSLAVPWDLIIIDECHRLKSGVTKIRGRLTFSLSGRHWVMLSGTPLVNRPRELWPLIHHLAPRMFPSKYDYFKEYCGGGNFFDKWSGAQNLPKLQQLIRSALMIRRLKRDILVNLPAKRRQVIELPANGDKKAIQQELTIWQPHERQISALQLRVEIAKASDNPNDYKRAVAALRASLSVAFEELSRVRRETAILKIPVVTELVAEILSEGQKLLLACHHKEVADSYYESFKQEAVLYHGDVSLKAREKAVTAFNEDESVRLFVGTIGAAGEGINLQQSCSVAGFSELDWVPGRVTQFEDRIHRRGQSKGVLIIHWVLEGSLDARMAQVLVEKQDVADRTLDTISEDELVAPTSNQISTRDVKPEQIAKLALDITKDDIKTVREALNILREDFSQADSPLAEFILEQRTISARFAVLGKRLAYRYRSKLAGRKSVERLFQ